MPQAAAVRIVNFLLKWNQASARSGRFTASVRRPTGRSVRKFPISAMPTAPPGAILAGSMKLCVPILYTTAPASKNSTSLIAFLLIIPFIPYAFPSFSSPCRAAFL